MNDAFLPFLIGAAGAAVQEAAHWYGLRHRLSEARLRALSKSRGYWATTAAMAIGSGFGTWAWYHGETQSLRTYFLIGAAFPLLLKKVIATFGESLRLGDAAGESGHGVLLREYFQ